MKPPIKRDIFRSAVPGCPLVGIVFCGDVVELVWAKDDDVLEKRMGGARRRVEERLAPLPPDPGPSFPGGKPSPLARRQNAEMHRRMRSKS